MFLLSRWSGGLVEKYGARKPLVVGPLIAAAGFVLFAVPGLEGSYWTTVFPAVLVLGLGMSISVAPLTTTVMGAVDERHVGIGSGINNAVARGAGLIAVAALGLVMLGLFNRQLDARLEALSLPAEARQALASGRNQLAAIEVPSTLSAGQKKAVRSAIDRSFLTGFRGVMLTAAVLALLAAMSAWRTIDEPKRKGRAAP
jgi:MFS family permease